LQSSYKITRANFEKRGTVRCGPILSAKNGHGKKTKFTKMNVLDVPAQSIPDFLDPKIQDEIQKNKDGTLSHIISRIYPENFISVCYELGELDVPAQADFIGALIAF